MAKTIIITNGSGTTNLINGSFDVTACVTGYDNSTIDPNTLNVAEGTNTYAFTIGATGTLTLHVTEEGTCGGTIVTPATFVRTDSEGNEYGTPITTDSNGDAVFNNVPYAATGAPTIYFKQISSDGEHEYDSEVQSTTMTTCTATLQIQNENGEERTITLTDANYANLPIANGTLTFTNTNE